MTLNLFAAATVVLALLLAATLHRFFAGPTIFDRFLAVAMSGTTTTFILGTIGFWFEREDMFIDLLVAYALLNFVVVVVAGKFLEKRKEIP